MSDTENLNEVQVEERSTRVPSSRSKKDEKKKANIFKRFFAFFAQVFAELKKVQKPTKKELWDIFVTVVVFVAIIMAIVFGFDFIFQKLIFWVFA